MLQAVRFRAADGHEINLRRGRLIGTASDSDEDATLEDDLRPTFRPLSSPDALVLEVCGPLHFVAAYSRQHCPGAKLRLVSLLNTGL